jgi:exosome complex component RRP45
MTLNFFQIIRVSSQVSSEILKPKETRPNEGLLRINLELSPMAAQHFEQNKYSKTFHSKKRTKIYNFLIKRQSDFSVELNRLLERNVKQSRCLDVEALCIRAGEKGLFQVFLLFILKFF